MKTLHRLTCSTILALAATACGSGTANVDSTATTTSPTTTIDQEASAVTTTPTSTTTSIPAPTFPDLDCSLAPIADFAPLPSWSRDEVLVLTELDFDGDGTTEALVNPAGNTSQSAVLVRRNGCELEQVPHIATSGADVGFLSYFLAGNANLGAAADLICLPALGGGTELINIWTSATDDIFGAEDPLAALEEWQNGGQGLNVTVDRWSYDGTVLRQTSSSEPDFAFAATHRWPYRNDFACEDRPAANTMLPVDDAGVGPVAFGASVSDAIASLEPLIGPPLSDTGYNNLPVVYCSEGSVQVVSWGGLQLTFTDESFGSYAPGLVNVRADHSMWPPTSGQTFAGFECAE